MDIDTDPTTRELFDALDEARHMLAGRSYLERDLSITRVWAEVRRFAPDIADELADYLRTEFD